MKPSQKQIIEYALGAGADDVHIVSAADFAAQWHAPLVQSVLPGATCLIVLFAQYLPAAPAPEGQMAMSAYYTASHRLHDAADKLTAWLCENGAGALHARDLPCKAAALRTGGFLGNNGFYFHPEFGSFVTIRTVLADAVTAADIEVASDSCRRCGACTAACPSGGVGNIQNCLRQHILGEVPAQLRKDVYQLIGCEKCQTACPINRRASSLPHSYPIADLLDGRHLGALQTLAGTNFLRKQRVRSMAALFAANTGYAPVLEQLEQMKSTAPEPVCTHAAWAAAQLRAKGECE